MNVLSEPVLVLNRGWVPIKVVTRKKAICMVLTTYKSGEPRAKILDPVNDFRQFTWDDWKELKARADEQVVRSADDVYRAPDIIILTRHNKIRKPDADTFNRRAIFHRDNFTCQYCGKRFPTSELSIEHVTPRRLGGKSTWENCVIACTRCNFRKGGRTPEQAGMKLLRKPTKPKYTFPYKQYRCKTWESVLGVGYWLVELENDNGS